MRLGYRYARDNDYDVAIQLDADGQHDPRYVPKLVDGLDDGRPRHRRPLRRRGRLPCAGPAAGRWSCSPRLSGWPRRKLTDTTSGFRACNRRVIELFASWYPVEYLGDTVETLVRVTAPSTVRRCRWRCVARVAGVPSHSPLKAAVYLGRAFIALLLALIRR